MNKIDPKEVELDKIYNLFYVAQNCVFDECGDGSGLIITEEYKELVNLFENFDKENGTLFPNRSDNLEHRYIVFSDNEQSSISFTDLWATTPDYSFYEFIIKFNTFYI